MRTLNVRLTITISCGGAGLVPDGAGDVRCRDLTGRRGDCVRSGVAGPGLPLVKWRGLAVHLGEAGRPWATPRAFRWSRGRGRSGPGVRRMESAVEAPGPPPGAGAVGEDRSSAHLEAVAHEG